MFNLRLKKSVPNTFKEELSSDPLVLKISADCTLKPPSSKT
jgi:hypothetical protein